MRSVFTILATLAIALSTGQVINDPFRAECQQNLNLPNYTQGSVPFYNFIHSQSEISKFTVRYAFDGRPLNTGNSHMDIYLKPAALPGGAQAPKRPIVFLLHGGDGSKDAPGIMKEAVRWARRGYISVVPDYRAGRDPLYGETTCRDSIQLALAVQHAVVDIRGAIRKVLSLAVENSQFGLVADTSSVFLAGFSWGAITAYSLAVSDSHEWLVNGEAAQGIIYYSDDSHTTVQSVLNYYSNLDDLNVNSTVVSLNKNTIKGVSCTAMSTMNISMIDSTDTIPLLFYHGTCDPSATFNKVNSRQLLINAISAGMASQGLTVPSDPGHPIFPCNEPQYNFTFYGPQAILEYVKNEIQPIGQIPFMTRMFRLCGGQHGIDNETAEFERAMFFYDILNGDYSRSEDFTLDFTMMLPPNFNPLGTREYFNCFYQFQSGSWPQVNQYCKTCAGYQSKLNAVSRCPYIDPQQSVDSPQRYKSKPSGYCASLGSSQIMTAESGPVFYENMQVLEVFDLSGRLLTQTTIQGYLAEAEQAYIRRSGLKPGVYIFRCAGIAHKMGVFY